MNQLTYNNPVVESTPTSEITERETPKDPVEQVQAKVMSFFEGVDETVPDGTVQQIGPYEVTRKDDTSLMDNPRTTFTASTSGITLAEHGTETMDGVPMNIFKLYGKDGMGDDANLLVLNKAGEDPQVRVTMVEPGSNGAIITRSRENFTPDLTQRINKVFGVKF